jgi:predicted nucleotidyltransferase
MNLAELVKQNRAQILDIAAKHEASSVRVFGSVARGEADEKSDLDLLVKIDTEKTGFAYFRLLDDMQDELHELLGVKVDVVDENGLKTRMRERVLKEAVSL